MSKPLFTLNVALNGSTLPMFFEDYNVLLSTKAVLVDAGIPGVTSEEDPTTRHVFIKPSTAAAHVRLWVDSLMGHRNATAPPKAALAAPPASRAQRPEETTEGVGRKEETLALMQRPEGVTLAELVSRFGILRNSASALPGLAARKYGFEVVKDGEHYRAVKVKKARKRRAKGRAANKAGGASETRQSLH